ncbi:MAG: GNAT family N-acetyltransferase [Promethearchaeota archaeon]|nr:MAG: GNAT family N-acetyltransferase [Candidatus Lokiarchaeota archaeon]
MENKIAGQIAEFLNNYNKLDKFFQKNEILKDFKNYQYLIDGAKDLIGAVKLIKFDWYLGGIKHLTVKDSLRRQGYGVKLLEMAEKDALDQNIRVLQATIRKNDLASINCFNRRGYKEVNCFFNKRTNRNILIFQKILSLC